MNKKIYDKLEELKELSKEQGDFHTAAMAATMMGCERDPQGKLMLSNLVSGFTKARVNQIQSEKNGIAN